MKKTKKPKRVKIEYREVISEVAEYTCPVCRTLFIGAGIKRNITRFKCDCGQELIVEVM